MVKMLGLKKGTVQLSNHNEQWNILFQEIKDELFEMIGKDIIDIQHIGSTAIIGIKAKPILDIAIAVENKSNFDELKSKLESCDYEHRGDKGNNGGELFVKGLAPDIRTQHLHIVEITDPQWQNYLAFRDFLNTHQEIAQEYEQLKIDLLEKFADDRSLYTASKQKFIERILQITQNNLD